LDSADSAFINPLKSCVKNMNYQSRYISLLREIPTNARISNHKEKEASVNFHSAQKLNLYYFAPPF